MTNFAKFLSINGLKRKDIASFLGVSGAFISQISSGDRPLPEEKLAMIKANAYNWDISMLVQPENPMTDEPKANGLVDYLTRKVSDQEVLIRELYQQIGMLEAKLDLARKGEIASAAVGSSDANVG
jgi:transcriptional regulator with XRE-family HTH domain